MKTLFSLATLFLISSICLIAQEETDLPNLTMPSPEAHAITRYGNIPINESTGKVTFNLPVYTYKVGKLEVPISLNYLGNGVKVNAPNTWTGVNWTLDETMS